MRCASNFASTLRSLVRMDDVIENGLALYSTELIGYSLSPLLRALVVCHDYDVVDRTMVSSSAEIAQKRYHAGADVSWEAI